jgi:long-subunit acyl-CoA synthetase (AMP-forming)
MVEFGSDLPAMTVARRRSIPLIELSHRARDVAGKFTLQGGKGADVPRLGLPEAEDVALILSTSGTTSRPRMVPLSHAKQSSLCTASRRESTGFSGPRASISSEFREMSWSRATAGLIA